VTERFFAVNRPVIVKKGWVGEVETNLVQAYIGEWVTFKIPMPSGSFLEVRLPVEDAIEAGVINEEEELSLDELDN
jgi:hypothetical protein